MIYATKSLKYIKATSIHSTSHFNMHLETIWKHYMAATYN